MPELPEVETIRRDLSRLLLNKKIKKVAVRKPKMINGSARSFVARLKGKKISRLERRGKLLIFVIKDEDMYLLVHLKMTGQLIFSDGKKIKGGGHGYPIITKEDLPNKYSHIIIDFSDGARLFFNDMRQFGYMRLVNMEELKEVKQKFGVEPLQKDFTVDVVSLATKNRKTALKNVLLDQSRIAGLGNIYVDEACFVAKVKPTRKADRLTRDETVRLHRAIKQVLQKAVKYRGTTFGTYRDGTGGEGNFVRLLKVYGRGGEKCRKCQTTIKRVVVGGRGTCYCPHCQV